MEILVVGGTGITGRSTVKHVLDGGATVKIGTREPTTPEPISGATYVAFDWAAASGWPDALAGVGAVYFVMPLMPPPFAPLAGAFVDAIKAAGVKHIVYLTGALLESDGFTFGIEARAIIELVKASGLTYTIIDANFFMSNHMTFQKGPIDGMGCFFGASEGKRISFVSPDDMGALAAAALLDPAAHNGKKYIAAGPAITEAEVAVFLSEYLGKHVKYTNQSPEEFGAGMTASGAPPFVVENLVELEKWKASGGADFGEGSEEMIAVLGRAPQTYPEYLASLPKTIA